MGNHTTATATSSVYSVRAHPCARNRDAPFLSQLTGPASGDSQMMVVVDAGSCGDAVEVRVFQGDPETGVSAAAGVQPSWAIGIVAAVGVVLGMRA